MAIKILIVDDHNVVREGLRGFLTLDPEIEVLGEAIDGQEALELAQKLEPEVILMDLSLPVMNGYQAIEAIRRIMPEVKILALTSSLEQATVAQALKAGANGYILKNMDAEAIRRAIKSASESQVVLSPQVAALFTQGAITTIAPTPAEKATVPAVRSLSPNSELLTLRENEVMQLLALGLSNKEIAYRLGLSDKTVKLHVSIILAKLNTQSRTQAVIQAIRMGLVNAELDPEQSFADN